MPQKELHGEFPNVDFIRSHSQNLEDELQKLGLKIKHHEDNLKFLKTQIDSIDESILDMQVNLGKYHSSARAADNNNLSTTESEKQTIENTLQRQQSAAGVIYQMKIRHGLQASKLLVTKDVLGVVATLGKVKDDNLSSLFSEYLGLENMLALVCKTYEGVKALEKYDKEGMIEKRSGLNGLGLSIGRHLDGRYLVFCIENLRPYTGEFVPEDPQKKLALLKPRLPNGEPPPGFIGFAVNMIDVDHMHLSCITASGHGLRETLFHNLFARLQVYKTRSDMQRAMPCISEGAISLDGGIMKSSGLFYLGGRKNTEVRFPISSGISRLPADVIEIEEQLKLTNWKKERLLEDMQREDTLLNHVKTMFNTKKQEYANYLRQTAQNLQQEKMIGLWDSHKDYDWDQNGHGHDEAFGNMSSSQGGEPIIGFHNGNAHPSTNASSEVPLSSSRKRISGVWEHFEMVEVNGDQKASCKKCRKDLSCKSNGGTSHLRRHIRSHEIQLAHAQAILSFARVLKGNPN